MGFFKTTASILGTTARVGAKLGVATVKVTANALNSSAKFAVEHRGKISAVTKSAVALSGKVVSGAGSAMATGAGALANGLHKASSKSTSKSGKVALRAAGYAADAASVMGKTARGFGGAVQAVSPAVGGAAGGVVSGTLRTVSGTLDSVAITEGDFDDLRRRMLEASATARAQSDRDLSAIEQAQRRHRKKDLLDLLVVGGVTLAEIVRDPSKTPPDVERAFQLAYPGLAGNGESFASVVERLPAENLVGLVNGVKGKLFEIELVAHLNDGHLPSGAQAELAGSPTQPGYDIRIHDGNGQTIDELQAKATESVDYVKDALQRYPDIDVTTTTEVYSQLVAHSVADRVTDSGISEAALQQKVEAAAASSDSFDIGELVPSSIGLAVIALSSFMDKSATLEARGDEFGSRAARTSITGLAAKAVLVATNTWWLGLAVGLGSQWLAKQGGNKRERYETLQNVVEALEARVARRAHGRRSAASPTDA